jgi:quinol monooxygenase YgiN
MKTALIVKMTVKEGMRDAMAEKLAAMMPVVENEEGTELYLLHDDAADANVLWMYELYTDGDALAAHGGSPEMAELMGSLGDYVEASEMSFMTPRVFSGYPA